MQYFTALVCQKGDSAFGLAFPDLPGCFAAADTWDGIPAAATETLDLWFEDMPDVAPAPLDEVRRRPEVAEALADGASLMHVPYIAAGAVVERVNITLERELLRAIDQTAKARGMNRSSFLAVAARHTLVGA